MKNLKIGVKLVGGFILTAMIVLVVGLLAMQQQNKLHDIAEELTDNALPAVENMLIVKSEANYIAALMRTLLTPFATKQQREATHQGLIDSRKIYGAAKKKFMELDFFNTVAPEWQTFSDHISKWVEANNKAVMFSKELIEKDMTNPIVLNEHMQQFEVAHLRLLNNVYLLIDKDIPFKGGTDANTCILGKWINNMDTANPEIVALVSKIKPSHTKLHQAVDKVKQYKANGQDLLAKETFYDDVLPASKQVFTTFHEMTAIISKSYIAFNEMNTLLLVEAATHQKNTFEAIDAIVSKAGERARVVAKQSETVAKTARTINLIGIVVGIALALCLGFYLTIIITRPLFKGVELSKAMADGDMTKTMDVDQKDEIGVLAKSLNNMAGNLRSIITDVNTGVSSVDDSSSQLSAIANQMSAGAEDTANRSSQVAAAAEEMSANQDSVAAAMEQASVNINMVASAAEEMNATITEIAQNSGRAKEITTQAVNQSEKASDRVDELGKAANEITKVTEAITEISEQTNLLALNATIEAARAGEAGKGFAVVANEIKDLAKQTAEATLDIKTKIEGIQQATGITVKEINEISTVIADVDQIVATIATAVEEQTATTREIAENVNQASTGIGEVNENVSQSSAVASEIATDIAEVNNSANEMNRASTQVTESAKELSTVADRLKEIVAQFKV